MNIINRFVFQISNSENNEAFKGRGIKKGVQLGRGGFADVFR